LYQKREEKIQTKYAPIVAQNWQFSAHGVAGQLTLQDDGNGNLRGTINGTQQVIGLWDASAQKVSFLRIVDPTNLASIQVYTGYLSSHVQGIDFINYSLNYGLILLNRCCLPASSG
jgi:hypothetical protein